MKQIIELRDTKKRKMIAETFAKWHKKMEVLNIPKAMNHPK